jgi:dihydroflavonol-4-reductase
VQGHILAMEKGKVGESYHIAGEACTTYDVFKLASEIANVKTPMGVSPKILKVMSVLAKPFDSFTPDIFTSEFLRVIAGVTYIGDNSKAKRELGFNPRPISEGWVETVKHEMKILRM